MQQQAWLGALLLGVLVAPSAVAADAVHATLEPLGPVRIEGTVHALAQDATLLVLPAPDGAALVIEAPAGALRIVHGAREAVDNPVSGDVWMAPEHDETTIPLQDGRIVVRGAGPEFLGLVVPTGDSVLGMTLPAATRDLAPDPGPRDFVIGLGDPQPYNFRRTVPAQSFRLACEPAALDARGQVQVALTGAILEVEGADGVQTWELGERDVATQELGGVRATYRHEWTFAILALDAPDVRIAPGAGVEFYSRAPTLALDGRLAVAAAAGAVQVPGAAAQPRGDAVELEGQLLVRVARVASEPDVLGQSHEHTELQVEGEASKVLVAGQPLAAAMLPEAGTAAPVLGLAALLLAWLSGAGTKVLAMALSPAFAGVAPRVMLDNDRRRLIYQAVLHQPGTHMRELQRLTGLRWGSLQYHVAVLISIGLLRSAQSGRRTVLACDVHALAPEQIRALHLLRGPRARRVADAVTRAPSVTQRDVVEHAAVSPRLASRYLAMMADVGLVDALAGRPKRYLATARMAELLPRAGGAPAGMPPAR
ncbi:MAG TPA: hypothetical protein VGR28_14075 [Candidatus Thermoplasmatota archaeon]|jgi:hypothetical protein|nr:hypothetical protein [Candidatus Thermoplasmatota archaeon]